MNITKNVFINTGGYNVQASKPTHGTSGLVNPACNNDALTILRDVIVSGYHNGILVNEHTDGDNAWQTLVSDIQDPQNLGVADLNYWCVKGNVGAVEEFTKNGGANIRTRRIGSSLAPKETTEK